MKQERLKLVSAYEEFIGRSKRYPKNIRMSHSQYSIYLKVLEYLDMKTFHNCKEIVNNAVKDGEYIFN